MTNGTARSEGRVDADVNFLFPLLVFPPEADALFELLLENLCLDCRLLPLLLLLPLTLLPPVCASAPNCEMEPEEEGCRE